MSRFQLKGKIMWRYRRSRVVVALVAAIIVSTFPVVGHSSVTVQLPAGPEETRILTQDEAFTLMAESYASDFDVTTEEAKRRLQLQDAAGQLNSTLIERERDVIAGVAIEHTPEFRVVVHVTNGGEQRVRPYFANGPLATITSVQTVQWNLDQLTSDQARAMDIARLLGVYAESAVVNHQTIQLFVPDAAAFSAALDTASLQLPGTVEVVGNGGTAVDDDAADVIAGWPISSCTTGFTGYKQSTGVKGVFTAGHCGNSQNLQYGDYSALGSAGSHEWWWGSYDFQMHPTTATQYPRNLINALVNGTTYWIPVGGVMARTSQTNGVYVCKFGKTTYYKCATIVSNQYNASSHSVVPGGQYATYIWARNSSGCGGPCDMSQDGDSGGPVFSSSTSFTSAYGVIKGGAGTILPDGSREDLLYMSADYIINAGYRIYTYCPNNYYC